MFMVFREENPLPGAPLPQLIPWELIKAIAIVQLYLEDRFIEPPLLRRRPYSLLFQQTLALLSASGAMLPKRLAELFEEKLGFYSCTVPTFEQLLLARLISNGDFERHVNRVRRKKRCELSSGAGQKD